MFQKIVLKLKEVVKRIFQKIVLKKVMVKLKKVTERKIVNLKHHQKNKEKNTNKRNKILFKPFIKIHLHLNTNLNIHQEDLKQKIMC